MGNNPLNALSFGFSPLGNNARGRTTVTTAGVSGFLSGGFLEEGFLEEASAATTSYTYETPTEVPLYYDSITNTWCAEISREDQENREISLEIARKTNEDLTFLKQIGFTEA